MDRGSKIYVAGHRGLVGSAIVRRLQGLGFTNLVTREQRELDLRIQGDVEVFFRSEHPDFVFLAAARVGGILANNTYKAEFIFDNLAIAANVIDASYRVGVKKLLNLGSSCIYPKFAPLPLREDTLLSGPLEPTNEPYAIAKIAAIKLCRYYNEQYGTNFLSAMPTNLFGPGDNFNLETSHVLPALMRKFHLARLLQLRKFDEIRKDIRLCRLGFGLEISPDAGETDIKSALKQLGIHEGYVLLWGSGNALREFLYSDDLADAVVHLMINRSYAETGELINIGCGSDISVRDLAERLKSLVGYEGEISLDPSKPDGTPRKLLDSSRMESLGWTPAIGLDEGLKRFYAWYCAR